MDIPYINAEWVNKHTSYRELVDVLDRAFANTDIQVPQRQHYDLGDKFKGTLLTMPSWKTDDHIGVKLVNVFPDNPSINLPSIQGVYIHFDGKTGQPLCLIDAKSLTNKRTAAASALASNYLSRKDSKKLLLLGTGALAPDMIRAHISIRPIEEVFIWGRNFDKASQVAGQLSMDGISFKPIDDLEKFIPEMDIICTATMARDPLIKGDLVSDGTHIDLVGSYKPDMREADDKLIVRSTIFVDTMEGATKESGDLCIPLSKGIISPDDIIADLHHLCVKKNFRRQSRKEITLFKSVGYALEDLAAGNYLYNKHLHSKTF